MSKLLMMVISYALGSFVLKLFTALGIGIFTYKGLEALLRKFLDQLNAFISGVPADLLQILELMGFSEGLSVITSAMLTAAAIKSMKAFVGLA